MVRQCQVCKKLDYQNPELSFHRFPSNPEIRKIWFSNVGFEEGKRLPKYPDICSDHFDSQDIQIKSNGFRYIKSGATPKLSSSMFSETSNSSDTSQFNTPPRRPVRMGIIETNIEQCENESSIPGPSRLSVPYQPPKTCSEEVPSCSSTTVSASEAEDAMNEDQVIEHIETKPCRKVSVKRKRGYVGDMTSSDFSTPEKRKRNLNSVKGTVGNLRRQVRNLKMTVRRQKMRNTSLKSLLDLLTRKTLISDASHSTIKSSLSGPAEDIFERLLKGPTKQKYNPSLRSFALTLSFYSPKAYNFVRNTFNNTLPHLATISKWYKSVDGSPGFTSEALNALSLKQKQSSGPLLCNLVMDEISIRSQIEWTGQKFTGYVDIGTNLDGDTLPEAREALVFLVVCLNGSWKVPVGYFLIDGLSATEKAGLVRKCLEFIHESGIIVTSLTFDGAPTNLTMAETLGADFTNPLELKTSFKHPITNNDVYIYLDACHMLKLVRNCIGSQQVLQDGNNREIKWSYITKLVEKQNIEGLHAATKIRIRHLQWEREKMKVRLATQTMSKSVSDAITFIREDLKLKDFEGSTATSDFLLHFNNLFDIFNSRNRHAKYFYKRPLSTDTEQDFFEFIDKMKQYIISLTLKGRPITKCARRTGFLGFLICMESLKNMYHIYVKEKRYLQYILTYKLSQDHLELFFGAIRSRGGFNNNPTARQFEAAYKRLLIHTEITGTDTGNATNLEAIPILTSGSMNRILITETGENLEEGEEYLSFLQKVKNDIDESYLGSNAWDLTIYAEDVVGYIAGFVVKGLRKCVNCPKCLYLLESTSSSSLLQERKRYGKLVNANDLVVQVCKTAEKFFRFFHATENIFNKNIKNLIPILICQSMRLLPEALFDTFGTHMFDDEVLNEHPVQLVKLILKNYYQIRIHYETRKILDMSKQNRLRSMNTKMILFRNE